jgi:hypothetical protein
MKKEVNFIFVFLLVFVCFPVDCLACTSFAAYSQKTYYGMNFDHYINDIRFSIHKSNNSDTRVFSMDFFLSGNYSPTVSMNNQGLFSSCQLVYPEESPVEKNNENQMDMFELFYHTPFSTSKVKDIRDSIIDKTVICQNNFVHTLFADSSGDAMVLETDNKEKWMTDIMGKSMVMTNFFNKESGDNAAGVASGIGSDRYMSAKKYIDANIDSFSYDEGMTALQNTIQAGSPFPTQCSMLFDPAKAEVYVVMKRDFSKVWKVSINNGIIETFRGFDVRRSLRIGNRGLTAKDLETVESNIGIVGNMGTGGTISLLLIIFGIIGLLAIGLCILKVMKGKKSNK